VASILIIDDDVEFSSDVAACLEYKGYTVSTLDDYEKAVDTLIRDTPDLLILDLMFPENPTAGLEVARLVRRKKQTRDLPILMLTAVNQEFPTDLSADNIDHKWMPVQDFIEKPFKTEQLLAKIERLLRPRT